MQQKNELNTEKDNIEKLSTYESSLFIGQSYFINDESQNFLIFQPILNSFKIPTDLAERIITGQSKGL